MAMPSLSYLMLDSGYDPVFADGTSLTGTQAVAQAIMTRLKLFFGEWWENLALGLPVFQSMLGQLGSQRGLAAINLAVGGNGGVTGVLPAGNISPGINAATAVAMSNFGGL